MSIFPSFLCWKIKRRLDLWVCCECGSSPTHVLSSCPSWRPGDGQRQRVSPSTFSQPYWQWAREQVLEADTNNSRSQTCTLHSALFYVCHLRMWKRLLHSRTHWHKMRQAWACIRWGSSTCNYHGCSCSDAHKDEASDRTRSHLEIRRNASGLLKPCVYGHLNTFKNWFY